MLKRSTSRNPRSRGVKLKHVLQIAVLLGICFWLIYQVKYSHDKRRELSGKDAKLTSKEKDSADLKLGRKDLNPRLVENDSRDEKHVEEDDEDEDKHDEGEEEQDIEMNKREADRGEETEKNDEDGQEEEEEEEKEHEVGEEKRDKDEEADDIEKAQKYTDLEDDILDEEKQKDEETSDDREASEGKESSADNENAEGNEEEEKQGAVEDENLILLDEETRNEVDRSIHEAREENYKEDDASSAVVHDNNLLISSEMEKFDLEMANESKIAANTTDQYSEGDYNGTKSDGKETEMAEIDQKLKDAEAETKDGENVIDAAREVEDSPPQNSTADLSTGDLSGSSLPNATETILSSPVVQNLTVDGGGESSNTTSDGKGNDSVLAALDTSSMDPTNSTITDQGDAAVSHQNLNSDQTGEGEQNLRLPSDEKDNEGEKTQHQESQPNETGNVQTG